MRGITLVDWAIPAAYVTTGCEVLNDMGQIVRVVQPPNRTEVEQKRLARACKPPARQRGLTLTLFLLRRYGTDDDDEAPSQAG